MIFVYADKVFHKVCVSNCQVRIGSKIIRHVGVAAIPEEKRSPSLGSVYRPFGLELISLKTRGSF